MVKDEDRVGSGGVESESTCRGPWVLRDSPVFHIGPALASEVGRVDR